ncbi:HEPN domain-containing protein [Ruegeria faecimaris]|uniref:HEPN domain-containing protein n=1 Tax=Ruegeria faecimaris TaxID=686389 RepID=UPI002330656B|nr:HEPN domain-containing protein [Ruegeria faecimaris]
MRDSVEVNFKHIRDLAHSLDGLAGQATASERRTRNELAGMFSVTIVATYEGIIKETLVDYSGRFHPKFQAHVENDLAKTNAKIRWDDLRNYATKFGLAEWNDPASQKKKTIYDRLLKENRDVVERRFRKDLKGSYNNLFKWRNDYAHERLTSATFKDVYDAHRIAQYVIRTFVKAFDQG